jgi:hypothetical protein
VHDFYHHRNDQLEGQSLWERAAGRVNFQLSYHRATETRVFSDDTLSGEDIDDAYRPGQKAPGDWTIGDGPLNEDENTEEFWVGTFAQAAVQEGIHEVLEWLEVDGKKWLDPHGVHEGEIMQAVERLYHELVGIRSRPTGY